MKRCIAAWVWFVSLCVVASPRARAEEGSVLDQWLLAANDPEAGIGPSDTSTAQTFTAGITGTLAGVNVVIEGFSEPRRRRAPSSRSSVSRPSAADGLEHFRGDAEPFPHTNAARLRIPA